jgi:CarboxypepD_reg-like domain
MIALSTSNCGGGGGGGSGSSPNSSPTPSPAPSASPTPTVSPATSTVSGMLTDSVTKQPLPGITVAVQSTSLNAVTDTNGAFSIPGVPTGSQTLVFTNSVGGAVGTQAITVTGTTTNVGTITVPGQGNPPPAPPV